MSESRQYRLAGISRYEPRLLMNSRMIQGIFDDDNPETAELWKYPATGVWDPDRNTDEFCAQMPEYVLMSGT
jgi:hypothetical protein